MKVNIKELQSVVWKEGKYFVAQCLNVDVSSFGKTKRQALENLREALELFFEDDRQAKSHISAVRQPEIVGMHLQHA